MDGVLKQLVRLYTVMGSITKYFTLRIKEGKSVVSQAKFDKLAMMINGQLTKHVYNLITWLENKQKERDQQAAAARAAKNKTVDPSVAMQGGGGGHPAASVDQGVTVGTVQGLNLNKFNLNKLYVYDYVPCTRAVSFVPCSF